MNSMKRNARAEAPGVAVRDQGPMRTLQIVQSGRAASVYIYGYLVSSQWFEDETSPFSLRKKLEELEQAGVTSLHVHIDSDGGDVSAGWAIYNTLRDWPGAVISYADGYVASAAIYPFLAGSRRVANPMSAFYLHQAWGTRSGNADELRKAADELELLNDLGLEAFAAAGIDKGRAKELEKLETWLRPAEALELGIATEIQDRGEATAPQQSVRALILQALFRDEAETVNERRARLGLPAVEAKEYRMGLLSSGQPQEAKGAQEDRNGQSKAQETQEAQEGRNGRSEAQAAQGGHNERSEAQEGQEAPRTSAEANARREEETSGAGSQKGLAAFFARFAATAAE